MRFADRRHAGLALAERLDYLKTSLPIVLALPRGGVPVAYEVARRLRAPLDVLLVRKLGAPTQPELGFGAVSEGGVRLLNDRLVRLLRLDDRTIEAIAGLAREELDRRARRYREGRPSMDVTGRVVVLVDDGIATGSTARAGVEVLRRRGARKVVVAVPVASPDAMVALDREADEVVCLACPPSFAAVGQFYDDFQQTGDTEVVELLRGASGDAAIRPVDIETGTMVLPGDLTVPHAARGLVLFAHGSGSSRRSPRNRAVARTLNDAGIATLLFDLLSPAETHDRRLVFDIPLLSDRLVGATLWSAARPGLSRLPRGYFGASTGAAAALTSAAELGPGVDAVVSRGGRPDLAMARLAEVSAPTLLIVGGRDGPVIDLNREALRRLRSEARLEVVPGATHLFEEPGALERVGELARDWFVSHLGGRDGARRAAS